MIENIVSLFKYIRNLFDEIKFLSHLEIPVINCIFINHQVPN